MMTYILIFVAKLVEVSMATIRNVLVNRGEKIKGSIIGFFESMIWVLVVSQVLDGLSENPLKLIVYCLAFACGNYAGVIIEGKLAIGTSSLQVMVAEECKDDLSAALRENGYGVTVIKGMGRNGPVDMLTVVLRRKSIDAATALIHEYAPKAVIMVNDVRQFRNGYIKK